MHFGSRCTTVSVYKYRYLPLAAPTFRVYYRHSHYVGYSMSAFCRYGNHDYKIRWEQDVVWSSIPPQLLEALPEIARSPTAQRFFELTQGIPRYMWELACLSLVEERVAQIARVAFLRPDAVLSRKFAQFPTVDAAVKIVAADAMKHFDNAQPPMALVQRVNYFFGPLDNFVQTRLDIHLADHARSYGLSPHAIEYHQQLYRKEHELCARQGELQAAKQVIAGLCEKVRSMEAIGGEVQEASEYGAAREGLAQLALQQTEMEKTQQETALEVTSLRETIAYLTRANAQQHAIGADMAAELAELVAQLEESSQKTSAGLASGDASMKQLDQMRKRCDKSNTEGKRLHAQKKMVEEEKAVLEAECGDLKGRFVKLEAEMTTLVAGSAALEADKAILSTDLAVLQGELEGLRAAKTQEMLDLQKQCRYYQQLSNLSAPGPVSRSAELPNASLRPTKVSFDFAGATTRELDYLGFLVREAQSGMHDDDGTGSPAAAARRPTYHDSPGAPTVKAFDTLVDRIKHHMAADSIALLCPFRAMAVQMLMSCPRFMKNLGHVVRSSVPTSTANYEDEKEIFVRWWHRQSACVFVDRLQTVPVTSADFSTVVRCLSTSPSNQETFEMLHGLLYWMIAGQVNATGNEPPGQADDERVLVHIRKVVRACLVKNCAIGNVFSMLCYDRCLQTDTAVAVPSCCCCSKCDVQAAHQAIRFLCKSTPKRHTTPPISLT